METDVSPGRIRLWKWRVDDNKRTATGNYCFFVKFPKNKTKQNKKTKQKQKQNKKEEKKGSFSGKRRERERVKTAFSKIN